MRNSPLAYIELSAANLVHNFQALKNVAKKGVKMAAVVKANAYGHGQNEVAKILDAHTDYFAVNSISELESLRKTSKKKTFVLGYTQESDLKKAFRLGAVVSVFSTEHLLHIQKNADKTVEVNIAIDALLGREGLMERDLPLFFDELKKCKKIKVLGIYAHFANIEDTTNFTHAKKQILKFNKVLEIVKKAGLKNIQTHISATSGLLVYEKNKGVHSVVRMGVGLYGMWPSEHIHFLYQKKMELKSILSWKTKIAQIKTIPAGRTIGYGLSHMTYKATNIAVIPQGYSDGYDRKLSNKGEVLIAGRRCPILGRVAMNMFVVDVSHLPGVQAEDEVVLLGKQGGEEITAEELADKVGTINYEITTRLSPLLPRKVI